MASIFFLIEKYTYCKVHVEVGTHVSTIQVKKQDLVTTPPLFLRLPDFSELSFWGLLGGDLNRPCFPFMSAR